MQNTVLNGLSLVDTGGFIVLSSIVVALVLGVSLNLFLRGRYAGLERDLAGHIERGDPFRYRVLDRIFRDANEARKRRRAEINTQAIIEQSFQRDLSGCLLAERFVKAVAGLTIILGLVGTFYGLSMSIGKLVGLVSEGNAGVADVTQTLTHGLAEALRGMSVAFSSSLFGIVTAIIMTVLGVVSNVTDRRLGVMVQIEAYLDNVLLADGQGVDADGAGDGASGLVNAATTQRLERIVESFGRSVAQLEGAVTHFDGSLANFSATTRDFQEFNHHLKDNIQRMSLGFSDMGEALKAHAAATTRRDRG